MDSPPRPPDVPAPHFLHIPKSAGTSVTHRLAGQIAPGLVCPARNRDQIVRASDDGDLGHDRLSCGDYG